MGLATVEEKSISKIVVLGLGAIGSRVALMLLKAGHPGIVSSSSPAAMVTLVNVGALAVATPKATAADADADAVMAIVRDDEASREVWLDAQCGALTSMRSGATAVESSTLTP